MTQRIFILFAGFIISTLPLTLGAQSFSLADPGFNKCQNPAASWVDLDNDGDLDIFISGVDESNLPNYHIYRNDGGGSFVEFYPAITGVTYAACAFGDLNNDGLADLALSGYDGSNDICKIYRNEGGFVFTDISAGIIGLSDGSLAWADHDHDAFTDLLVCGFDNDDYPVTKLYKNENGNSFTEVSLSLSGLAKSSLSWSDLDNDEDFDFAICGLDSLGQARTYIYVNQDGDYTKMGAGITGLYGGMLDWGDYNNDGYADLLISGLDDTNASQTYIYKNVSGSSFVQLAGSYSDVANGSSFWGDFNNDGLLDIIVAGRPQTGISPPPPADDPFMNVYLNISEDQFQEHQIPLPVPYDNHIVCGDYDNDSDLDLLLTGSFVNPISGSDDHTILFRNEATSVNNAPAAPTGLGYEVAGTDLIFEWSATIDDQTPPAGLNYNFRIGSQPDNMDFLSALADP
ncbi:MAG: VCBS repeat-containing protein, partial [Bacteroidota bacterium]